MHKVCVRLDDFGLPDVYADVKDNYTVVQLQNDLFKNNILPFTLFSSIYLTRDGLCAGCNDVVTAGAAFTARLRVRGGKGGFGSMLRAIGSQIEKTTNMEACRDLSGRRMRDVNNEKKMMEWIKQKADKDNQKQKEKIEKLERQLQKPKHFFNDPEYERKLEETTDSVEDALKKGLQVHKRKSTNGASSNVKDSAAKKSKLWLGMDDISDSSGSDDEDEMSQPPSKCNDERGCSSKDLIVIKETTEIPAETIDSQNLEDKTSLTPESYDKPKSTDLTENNVTSVMTSQITKSETT